MRKLAIFIAVVTVVFVFSGLSSADLNDGLVAYYPFNGNANDESGNGNDGVVNGATLSEDKSGNPGRAYSFDGDDKIVIPNSSNLKFGINSFSISFWIKTSANKWCYVLDKDHSNAPSGFYRFRFSGGESDPNIHFQIGDAAHCCTSTEAINTTDIIDGKWHHIVGVRDTTSGVLQIYLDGSLESTEIDNIINSTDNNYSLVFGGPSASNNSYFEGKLDEIRVYNHALSEEQIIELFSYQSQQNKGFNAKGYFRNFDNLGLITWENSNTAQIQIKDQYGDIKYSNQVDNTYHVWLPSNFIDENTQFSVNKIGDKAIWQNFQKPPENVIMWAHEKEVVSVLYDSLTTLGGWLLDLYGTVGSLKTSIVILPPGVLNFFDSYSFGPHSEDGMRFVTACPFDATLIDPDGLILSNSVNQLSGSAVFAEYDVFNNDDPIELALISQMKKGEYRIQISPEDRATSSSVFSLLIDEYSYGSWVNTFAKMDQNIGLGEQFSEYTYLANSTNSVDLIAAFVTRFYNLCLDRNPDQPGLYGWISALMDNSRTGSDVANGFCVQSGVSQ